MKALSKCDFCRFWTGRSCMVANNQRYCAEALKEYLQYTKKGVQQPQRKSLRQWEK